MEEINPLISIITVVYNGAKSIENTIQSIIGQTYSNLEYIIIDGGSTDGTLDIIKKYADNISLWYSEPDNGIYDAMNKGIERANGVWINYMNSGDSFFNNNVISNVFQCVSNEEIIYGNTMIKIGNELVKTNYRKLTKHDPMPFCHQSVFVKRNLLKKNNFDLKYKICSDRNFFYACFENSCTYLPLNQTISIIESTGFSTKNRFIHIKEKQQILNEPKLIYKIRYIKEFIKSILFILFPTNFYSKLKILNSKFYK